MKYIETRMQSPNKFQNKVNEKLLCVLHHTGLYPTHGIISHFMNPKSEASAHVLIDTDGTRYIFGEDSDCFWHAGLSEWMGRSVVNMFGVGVEFRGDTNKNPLTEAQIESFLEWFKPRADVYNWTLDKVVDHRMISPGRKVDLNIKEYERVLEAIKKSYE